MLDSGPRRTTFISMNARRDYEGFLSERVTVVWQRGIRLATRIAIAFGLSTVTAIFLGAAVTDNAFAQIAITILAAFALWLPFVFLVSRVERLVNRRRSSRAERASVNRTAGSPGDESWRRLAAIAPVQSDRLSALRRSLEQSRLELGKADLDPDAHDLCILIDRRLPELIHSELDTLARDDRNRGRQLGELIDLIEQFARRCSRKRSDAEAAEYEAEVLRRRFEARLSGH
jgi:hypothetical protein